jgi:hypothetical protein
MVALFIISGAVGPIVFPVPLPDVVLYRVICSDSCREWFSCLKVNAQYLLTVTRRSDVKCCEMCSVGNSCSWMHDLAGLCCGDT